MERVRRLRAMALLCRQTAVYHPDRNWALLAEAEHWEHLADEALREQFEQCTANSLPQPTDDPNNTRGTTAAVA